MTQYFHETVNIVNKGLSFSIFVKHFAKQATNKEKTTEKHIRDFYEMSSVTRLKGYTVASEYVKTVKDS